MDKTEYVFCVICERLQIETWIWLLNREKTSIGLCPECREKRKTNRHFLDRIASALERIARNKCSE